MLCEFSNKLFLFSLSAASVPGFLPILDVLHFFSSSLGRLLITSFFLMAGRLFIHSDFASSVMFLSVFHLCFSFCTSFSVLQVLFLHLPLSRPFLHRYVRSLIINDSSSFTFIILLYKSCKKSQGKHKVSHLINFAACLVIDISLWH